jgi:hypothetical protein
MRTSSTALFVSTLVMILGAGCATPGITSAGARVSASEAPPPATCSPLGEVSGHSGGQFSGQFIDNHALVGSALNDARNAAATLGADYLHISQPQLGVYYGSTRTASYGGRAYRCGPPETRAGSAPVATR